MRIPSGSTDRYVYFVAVDATDLKTRETGLTTFTVYRSRNGAAAAAMTTPTINETDATNMPGVYELLLDEDTTLAAGNDTEEICFHITQASMAPVTRTIEIYRPETTEGNTLDVTATGAGGIDWGNIENKTTANDLSGTDIQLCDTVTTNTDLVTAASIADAVWDEDATGHQTLGTFGKAIGDPGAGADTLYSLVGTNLDAQVSTRSTFDHTADLVQISGLLNTLDDLNNVSTSDLAAALTDIHLDHLLAVDYDPATPPGVATALLNELVESDAGVSRFTTNALENAPGGSPPTAAAIADAVWDEAQSGHVGAGTFGEIATEIASILADTGELQTNQGNWLTATGFSTHSAADVADAVWDELQSAHVTVGSFGEIATEMASVLADTNELQTDDVPGLIAALNDISTAQVNTEVDNAIVTYGLDHLVAAAVTGTDITDNSIIAKLASKSATADWDSYVNTTDSLEAIADSGGGGPTAEQIADQVWDELQSAHVTAGSFGEIATEIASILVDTAEIGAAGAGLTALATQASLDTVDINVDAILADTNELQADWTDSGRLDVILDAILVDTGTTLETHLTDIKGATFSGATDSLEQLRDRGDAAWITGSGTGLTALASGTAQAGTASTIQLAAGHSFADDELNGNIVAIHTGTGAGQSRVITDYTGATDTATVTPNWTTNPDATSQYEVVNGSANITAVSNVAEDVATATALATVDTNVDAILVDTNELQGDWQNGGRLDTIIDNILVDTAEIGTAGAGLTAITLTGTQTYNISGNITGNLSGSVGNVTGAVGSVTGAVTIDAASVDAIWDEDLTTHNNVNSFGEAVDDILEDTADLQANQGNWLTATGFSTHTAANVRTEMDSNSTQLAAIVADTNELQTDDVPGLIAALNDPTAAVIADAVWDEAQAGHVTAGTFGKYLDTEVSGVGGGGSGDITDIMGTALTESAGGQLAAAFSNFFDVATPLKTINDVGYGAGTNNSGSRPDYLQTTTGRDLYSKELPLDTGTWTNGVTLGAENGTTGSYSFNVNNNPHIIYEEGTPGSQLSTDTAIGFIEAVNQDPALLQETTIATLATQTSFTLTAGSADDDAYNDAAIIITDATTGTQVAYGTVSDYTGATKTVTLSSDPAIFTMAVGDSVKIIVSGTGSGGGATAGAIADAVWDEAQADHVAAGSFGETATEIASVLADTNELQTDDVPGLIAGLNDPSAASIADAVWDETAADHVAAGSTGEELQDAGAGGAITVTPVQGVVSDPVTETAITIFQGETKVIAIAVTDTDGNAVDVSGMTLEVAIEDLSGNDLASVPNASITKITSTASFSVPAAASATVGGFRWSMRQSAGNAVVMHGSWTVIEAPDVD